MHIRNQKETRDQNARGEEMRKVGTFSVNVLKNGAVFLFGLSGTFVIAGIGLLFAVYFTILLPVTIVALIAIGLSGLMGGTIRRTEK